MANKITHTQIIDPDGKVIPLNKTYAKGVYPHITDGTFLPFLASNFGQIQDPTALKFGKTITILGRVKRAFDGYLDNQNDGDGVNNTIKDMPAVQRRVYKVSESSPLEAGSIILLPKEDYAKIGFTNIISDEVEHYKSGARLGLRQYGLSQIINSALNYKQYKNDGKGGENDSSLTVSDATTIDELVEEIGNNATSYVVGNQLDEEKLYEQDAIIKIVNAIGERYAEIGINIDEYHPTITSGIKADDIICITTKKVMNSASNTSRHTQMYKLPSGIETQITSISKIRFVDDPLVKQYLDGKARMIFIKASAYAIVKEMVEGKNYLGVVSRGTDRALKVKKFDGTVETLNLTINDTTLAFNHTLYFGEKLKGTAFVVRVK